MELIDKKINDALNKELEATESSTNNLYKRLTDEKTCAIISPYRGENSDKENKQKMALLKSEVRKLKLGFNQFISRWVEDGEAFDEQSLMIPNITEQQAIKLGKEFNQSSIIFKDKESCREICTTDFEKYHAGEIVRVFYNTGNHILNIEEAKEIFSKRKGGPASMPIKGDKRPFTLKEKKAIESFELYEIEQPRASYFQSKERHTKII